MPITNVFVADIVAGGADLSLTQSINVPHEVRKIEVECLLNYDLAVARENDQNSILRLRSDVCGGQQIISCVGTMGNVWTPKTTFTFEDPIPVRGIFTFNFVTEDDNLEQAGDTATVVIKLAFHS